MRTNLVKQKISQGETSLGTFFIEFTSSGLGRLAAAAGAEFAVMDMEHTGWSVETMRQLIATSRCAEELMPFVRVPATEYHFIARLMDVGAMGIMMPMVHTAEQAAQIVDAAKYPPVGRRGAGFSNSHDDYAGGNIVEKMKTANDNVLLIAQIESVEGVENADAIAAVDGIDVLWIGHFDLTNSQGNPGEFDNPKFVAAVDTVVQACKKHGKTAGFMANSVEEGKRWLDLGFRLIAYGGDLWLYQQALRSGLQSLREV